MNKSCFGKKGWHNATEPFGHHCLLQWPLFHSSAAKSTSNLETFHARLNWWSTLVRGRTWSNPRTTLVDWRRGWQIWTIPSCVLWHCSNGTVCPQDASPNETILSSNTNLLVFKVPTGAHYSWQNCYSSLQVGRHQRLHDEQFPVSNNNQQTVPVCGRWVTYHRVGRLYM